LKFDTDEGNFDLVGNNTPVFFVRDPTKFQDFIHSQKRLPDTGLRSNDMVWDFWTLSPETAHRVIILMSDRGFPRTWRHMNGYGTHTFSWVNAADFVCVFAARRRSPAVGSEEGGASVRPPAPRRVRLPNHDALTGRCDEGRGNRSPTD
jgi:hypothetical protein